MSEPVALQHHAQNELCVAPIVHKAQGLTVDRSVVVLDELSRDRTGKMRF
ncbi:MAG: hypothetical protein LC749_11780 [Actinobacteria bacterium]|nr:hypothetical protein [Actinomycetota bacterium]